MQLVTCASASLGHKTRLALRQLWHEAYGDRFSDDDAEHAYGGVHVLAVKNGALIGHASAIPRSIRFGEGDWQTIAYVEAVAVYPEFQGKGIGTEVLRTLHEEMAQIWSVAMLSTGRATSFYESLGWRRWEGTSYTVTKDGTVPDGEHGGLMVISLVNDFRVDVHQTVTCEDRPGDAW